MRLRKIIRAAITVAFGRVGVTRRAETAPPCPGSYAFLTGSRQIVEAFSKANRLLCRDENTFLEDLLEVLDATEVDLFQRAVTSTGTQSALERKGSRLRDCVLLPRGWYPGTPIHPHSKEGCFATRAHRVQHDQPEAIDCRRSDAADRAGASR